LLDEPSGHGRYVRDSAVQRLRAVVTSGSVVTNHLRLPGGRASAASRSDTTTYTLDYMYDEKGIVFAGVYSGTDATSGVRFMMSTTDHQDVRDLIDEFGDAFDECPAW
jgi:hypothetical protein